IRRALWHAHEISPQHRLNDAVLYQEVNKVVEVMASAYPELKEAKGSIREVIKSEEERFLSTLDTGLRLLEDKLSQIKKKSGNIVSGEIIFELYDTYGFPDELTRKISEERGFKIDH